MSTTHEVVQGECLSVIAAQFGFGWQTVWDLPDNADLRKRRKSPNILFPGDIVVIPDVEPKAVTVPVGAVNRIVLNVPQTRLRVLILLNGAPLASENYQLTSDGAGTAVTRATNSDGEIDEIIPASTREVIVDFPNRRIRRRFMLGHLDPLETVAGAQARLLQLGFYQGKVDGIFGPLSKEAVFGFQSTQGLETTGDIDEATLSSLRDTYGT